MKREQFLTQLDTLADEASKSDDELMRQSAIVLLGLRASICAGDGFFDAFVDTVAMVIKNQRDVIAEIIKEMRR